MAITPKQLTIYAAQIADIYAAVEDTLFDKIAQRLKTPKDDGKDYVLQWQIEKLSQLGAVNEETIEALSIASELASDAIREIFSEAINQGAERIDNQVKASGAKIALQGVTDLDTLLAAYVTQTFRELDNFVNQTLITTNFGEGTVTTLYRKIVEESVGQVLVGNDTINQAVAKTVIKWQKEGINTGFVDKGGRTWHLEQYAQTVIRSTVNRAYNEVVLSRMRDYGLDLALYSSKTSARPACAPIQGKVVSLSNPSSNPKYPSIYDYGYGTPQGARGINCSHQLYVFIEGVNENNQSPPPEEQAEEKFEESQKQRYLERRIRESKRALRTAETLGDEQQIQKYKKQLADRQLKIREYVQETGLPRLYANERVIN